MVHSAIKWRLSGVFGRSSLCSLVVPYITQMWHKVGRCCGCITCMDLWMNPRSLFALAVC